MALYNELRSKDFSEIRGQQKAVKILKGIFQAGRIPNALLFVGERGTGKTSISRIIARMLNCEHPSDKGPCNMCPACKEALAESSMDIYELDAASNNSVTDIHALIDRSSYIPIRKKKVFIVDEIHMLSIAAFNALLKVVEEPSPNCVFIFCTTEEHKVPATIKSRCMTVYFEAIEEEVILDYLKEICEDRKKEYDPDALCLIARAANGGMRDALSMLEPFLSTSLTVEHVSEILGNPNEDMLFRCIFGMVRGDIKEGIEALQDIKKSGKNSRLLAKTMIEAFKDAAYVEAGGDVDKIINTSYYRAFIDTLAGELETGDAQLYIERLCEVYAASKYTTIDFALECAVLQLCSKKREDISFQTRLEELEKEVEYLKCLLKNPVNASDIERNEMQDMEQDISEENSDIKEEQVVEESLIKDLNEENKENPIEKELMPFLEKADPFISSDSICDEFASTNTNKQYEEVSSKIIGDIVGTVSMNNLIGEANGKEVKENMTKEKEAIKEEAKSKDKKQKTAVPSFWGFARHS